MKLIFRFFIKLCAVLITVSTCTISSQQFGNIASLPIDNGDFNFQYDIEQIRRASGRIIEFENEMIEFSGQFSAEVDIYPEGKENGRLLTFKDLPDQSSIIHLARERVFSNIIYPKNNDEQELEKQIVFDFTETINLVYELARLSSNLDLIEKNLDDVMNPNTTSFILKRKKIHEIEEYVRAIKYNTSRISFAIENRVFAPTQRQKEVFLFMIKVMNEAVSSYFTAKLDQPKMESDEDFPPIVNSIKTKLSIKNLKLHLGNSILASKVLLEMLEKRLKIG